MKRLLKNKTIKNILSAITIAFFGFILLNLAFLLDFVFQSTMDSFLDQSALIDIDTIREPYLAFRHIMFMAIIGVISWYVFRSKLKPIYKATYMTVPAAVIFATIGIFLYRWPILSYGVGALAGLSVLYYFYRTKQSWLYYYAVILVGLSLMIFTMMGGEI